MITDRPGLISTMDAAARAASVAPDTAMPQSAFFSAGASFTPSPVMPTMWPRFCSTSTMWNLCSGNTWANPSASSIDSAVAVVSWRPAPPRPTASRMPVPIPSVLAVSRAMATWSPVTILTATPSCRAVAMVALASARGGSKRGSTLRNCHGPSPSARATPSDRKPRAAKPPTALSTAFSTCPLLAASAMITCGAPFATLNEVPSAALTAASVRLRTGSKGWKWVTWYPCSAWPPSRPASTARSMASSSSERDASAALLDALGKALLLFAAAARHDHLDTRHWNAAEAAVKAIQIRWIDPDAGLWELQDHHWSHSRLMCVAGLRAIAAAGPAAQAAMWESLADVILADVAGDSVHPGGRWQRA